jgi:hypothetical protein
VTQPASGRLRERQILSARKRQPKKGAFTAAQCGALRAIDLSPAPEEFDGGNAEPTQGSQ